MHDTRSIICNPTCGSVSLPQEDQWLEGSGIPFGLQNSGLSPNFPDAACEAKSVLLQVTCSTQQPPTAQHIVDVIAITPRVAQQILSVMGAVQLTGGIGTIQAGNLLTEARYWHDQGLKGTKPGTAPAPVFDVLLTQALTASMVGATTAQLRHIGDYLLQDLTSGDVQILGSNEMEQPLVALDRAGSVVHTTSDSLFVTNMNLLQNYDSPDLVESVTDKITLDRHGQANHTLSLAYTYRPTLTLGAASMYSDVVTVVVPQSDGVPENKSAACAPIVSKVSSSTSYSCLLNLLPNQTVTVNFSWITSSIANTTGNGTYSLFVQRQPGAAPQTSISISVPPGAHLVDVSAGGHISQGTGQWFSPGLLANEVLTVRWSS
jgi:hypothetical protein